MKKISLLFFPILWGLILLIATTDLFPQRGMNVTVRMESGEELALYNDSHALVIGNGDYLVKNGWNPLPGAVSDVKEVAEVLERHGFNVTLKIDVTKAEFNKAFSEFIYKSGKSPDNRLLFYYAGHGYTTKSATGEDLGYLVMLDTPHPDDEAAFDLYSVDMVKFVSDSKKIHAKHVLFMFDSCFSGTILNLRNRVTPPHITDRIKNPVRQFITAGRADEPVPDESEFKKAFLNLLEGRVEEPTPDGYLTGVELGDYLYRTVPKFSQGQHPQHGKIHDQQLNTGDFVFVLSQNRHDSGIELDTMTTVNITSTPRSATVYVDGVVIGTTPLQDYPIDTGVSREKQVNVGLELSGYKSRVKKIGLKGGQAFSWNVNLDKMPEQPASPPSTPDIPPPQPIDDTQIDEKTVTYLSLASLKPGTLTPINDMTEWSGWHDWFWEKTNGEPSPDPPAGFSGHYVDRFDHWIYSHAESRVVYDISGGAYTQFDGYLITPNPCIETLEFIWSVDDRVVYNSGRVKVLEPLYFTFNIPADAEMLTLQVTDGGDGLLCDHWILGAPRLLRADQPITIIENDFTVNEEVRSPPSNIPQTILGEDTAPMVLIPAGEFQMGTRSDTIQNAATIPMHLVYIDAFYIDKYEVTVGQYNQFVRATNHHPLPDWVPQYSRTDAHPVVGVNWHDAMAYAKWAGKRLPTEAEWEKAARGGLVQKNYSWGDAALDGTQCNFADKNLRRIWNREKEWADENLDDGYAYTAPVGSYPPNGYGLYDMAGNVWEWCFDAYDENFYANSPYQNPIAGIVIKDGSNTIVAVNKLRVTRGASWYDGPPSVWIASRLGQPPGDKSFNVGFRCVKPVTP